MKLILHHLFLVVALDCHSCTCKSIDKITLDEILNAETVFIGTINSIVFDEANHKKIANFGVSKIIIGSQNQSEFSIETNIDGASCGLDFKVGQKWYIYAHNFEGKLHTGLCSRNVQLSKVNSKTKKYIIGRKNYRKSKMRVRQDISAFKKYTKENATNSP